MFLKPIIGLSLFSLLALMIGGCTTATPHESLKNAMNKTFDVSGYNYVSTTRITKLSFPKNDANATLDEENSVENKRTSIYLQKGIDVIRGLSFGLNGAVNYAGSIQSEATYDLHYNKDNVELSMKFPFMFDYSTKSLYMGKTFLNTIFPLKAEDEGKLIRFDLNDTLISTLIGEESMKQFDDKIVRSLNSAIKEGTLKAFNDMNSTLFSYQTVETKEKNAGSHKKVHLSLDRNQSITMTMSILDSMIQKMYAESMISKELYGSYLFLSDPKQLTPLMEEINLQLDFEFGIDSNGYIVYVQTLINASDKTDRFALGMENITTLENFNAPRFTLDPARSGSIDYMEAFREWKELIPDESAENPLEDLEKIVIPNGDPII